MSFPGFSEDTSNQIRIPDQFFRHVLLNIENLSELKLNLYIFWRLEHMEGPFHYICFTDLLSDSHLIKSLAKDPSKARPSIKAALRRAVKHGTLLQVDIPGEDEQDTIICLNSSKGRAMVAAIQRGEWRMTDNDKQPCEVFPEYPNIFQLYEANIGPLTPLIADALRDAENTYPADWIEDAFRISVERNKRNWNYIEAILHRWQEGGRNDRKNQQTRRDTEEAIRKYGKWDK
jgi:DnaD/phage-associated family protein